MSITHFSKAFFENLTQSNSKIFSITNPSSTHMIFISTTASIISTNCTPSNTGLLLYDIINNTSTTIGYSAATVTINSLSGASPQFSYIFAGDTIGYDVTLITSSNNSLLRFLYNPIIEYIKFYETNEKVISQASMNIINPVSNVKSSLKLTPGLLTNNVNYTTYFNPLTQSLNNTINVLCEFVKNYNSFISYASTTGSIFQNDYNAVITKYKTVRINLKEYLENVQIDTISGGGVRLASLKTSIVELKNSIKALYDVITLTDEVNPTKLIELKDLLYQLGLDRIVSDSQYVTFFPESSIVNDEYNKESVAF
jgi:hypothetical protein